MSFKSYSSKSSALKGAKRNGLSNELVYEKDGQWGFDVPDETSEPATPEAPVSKPAAPAPEADTSTGRKIEKDRPKQNGVTRPSAGGMCRAVWDFCDEINASGTLPTAPQVKAHAEAQGWNVNNASIEYYQWRKFHGIRGRQAKPAQEPEAK
jgi:hypothetical protein